MSIVLHVRGEIRTGAWRLFLEAVERYREYRRARGYVVPQVLVGLAGPMNTTVLVYRYDSLAQYEAEERKVSGEAEYARVASEMPFRDGTIVYELYREEGPSEPGPTLPLGRTRRGT